MILLLHLPSVPAVVVIETSHRPEFVLAMLRIRKIRYRRDPEDPDTLHLEET